MCDNVFGFFEAFVKSEEGFFRREFAVGVISMACVPGRFKTRRGMAVIYACDL